MSDVSTVAALFASFNSLKDIAQAMIGLRDTQLLQAKTLEFQDRLLDAQQKMFSVNDERAALIERVRELEKEVTNLEAWETEKQRYELQNIAYRSFVYAVKPSMQGTEPPHQICAKCYQDGKKSILQRQPSLGAIGMPDVLSCPRCKAKIEG